ncbi:MAG: hypothetical protein QN159_07945 [Armatimonadota bacterium]|nr:hypothetical protein [Armatimonadota bacterium]
MVGCVTAAGGRRRAFAQAYVTQAVVDGAHQSILAADAGYHSEANCLLLQGAGIDALTPPDKLKHTEGAIGGVLVAIVHDGWKLLRAER